MAKVGIVMGSDSDLPVMRKAAEMLEKFGIDYEMTIISAHRMPDVFFEYANGAEEKGYKVIIAGAGGAAHLPGMAAAIFTLPLPSANRWTSSSACWMRWRRIEGKPPQSLPRGERGEIHVKSNSLNS